MKSFAGWLRAEMEGRGWENVDLARQAGVSDPQVSRVLSGSRGAGPDFCVAIARALGLDPVYVFRRAGLLPDGEEPEREPEFAKLWAVMGQLTPENREDVIAYAIWRRQQQTEDGG